MAERGAGQCLIRHPQQAGRPAKMQVLNLACAGTCRLPRQAGIPGRQAGRHPASLTPDLPNHHLALQHKEIHGGEGGEGKEAEHEEHGACRQGRGPGGGAGGWVCGCVRAGGWQRQPALDSGDAGGTHTEQCQHPRAPSTQSQSPTHPRGFVPPTHQS